MSYMTEANAIAAALRGQGTQGVRTVPRRRAATEASPQNLRVLAFMREFFADNDQLPPLSVIVRHFSFRCSGSADWHIQALLRHGLLERNVLGKLKFARKAQS